MSKRKREVEAPGPASTTGHKRTKVSDPKDKTNPAVNGGPNTASAEHGQVVVTTQSKAEKAARKEAKRELWRKQRAEVAATGDKGTVKHRGQEKYGVEAWNVSDAAGGRMLDLDPVLSQDEQYVAMYAFTSLAHH